MGSRRLTVGVSAGGHGEIELKVPFMVVKRSKHRDPERRVCRFYFQVPTRYLAQGCTIPSTALGDHLGRANATAAVLYARFEDWKRDRDVVYVERKTSFGTFDWLAGEFLKTEHFLSRTEGTRAGFKCDLKRLSDVVFGEGTALAGKRLGDVKLKDITRVGVSGLIDGLHVMRTMEFGGSTHQVRCGGRARDLISTACTAWNHMSLRIELPELQNNPFQRHRIEQVVGTNLAASHDELLAVVAAADELGLPEVGTIALCCFEFRWRPKHVVDVLCAEHYRPPDHPDEILITDTKNKESVWRPLFGDGGEALYPALVERLDALKGDRVKGLMFDEGRIFGGKARTPGKMVRMNRLRKHIQAVCAHAGVRTLTPTTYRHGGITEMAEAGLSAHQIMSHTFHKDPRTVDIYIKRTATMQRDAQKAVLEHRERRRTAHAPEAPPATPTGREPTPAAEVVAPAKVEWGSTWGYGASWKVKVA